jgi:hypothetical protein
MADYPHDAQRFDDPQSDAYAYRWMQNNSYRLAVHWPFRRAPMFYAFFRDAAEADRQMRSHFANYRRQHPQRAR